MKMNIGEACTKIDSVYSAIFQQVYESNKVTFLRETNVIC